MTLTSPTDSSWTSQAPSLQAPLSLKPVEHVSILPSTAANATSESENAKEKKAHDEMQYLDLIRLILAQGEIRQDRTGTGTQSIFAPPQLRFSLRQQALPLLTTKRVFWRGVLEELLWFLHGKTDARLLQEKGIRIWDGNASRAYLDSIGLTHRAEGDLGPVYGFQWRHFGATYQDCHTNYDGQGVDQLAEVIDKIMHRPYDRRIILTAWNPADLKIMALPPCHMFCQFYVSDPEANRAQGQRPRLSCQLYQRSCDVGLGVPFNIASYAILTHMLAHVCDMEAAEFIHTMGDAHVYLDHVEALQAQMQRDPLPFPQIRFKTEAGGGLAALEHLKMEDIELIGYHPHGKIVMNMSV